jgi:hypothetical protein
MTSPATAGPPAAAAADSIKASEWIAGPPACNVAASRAGLGRQQHAEHLRMRCHGQPELRPVSCPGLATVTPEQMWRMRDQPSLF